MEKIRKANAPAYREAGAATELDYDTPFEGKGPFMVGSLLCGIGIG